jgi:hypothetical protein
VGGRGGYISYTSSINLRLDRTGKKACEWGGIRRAPQHFFKPGCTEKFCVDSMKVLCGLDKSLTSGRVSVAENTS